jgi:uncharacterized protein (TIGR03435 family)
MRSMAILVLVAGGVIASAQPPQSPTADVAFEVASIKPNVSASNSSTTRTVPGGFQATNAQVQWLISYGYDIRPNQIAGVPAWAESSRFDVLARAAGDPSGEEIRQMVRTLLAERFKLALHKEAREQPTYALVLARTDAGPGPELKPSTRECSGGGASPCGVNMTTDSRGGTLRGTAIALQDLAGTLTGIVGRTVVDRTGLTGAFDVTLRFTRDTAAAGDSNALRGIAGDAPSIFSALSEQLGLKLESARGPVEFLVIDRIEQPTPD